MIVRAFAPASVANVAVGFDVLGFSAGVAGDTVTVEKLTADQNQNQNESKVVIGPTTGLDLKLPTDPLLNTATAGLVALIRDRNLDFGFKVSIQKGIPLGSGLGGSAASAVGAIFAANRILQDSKLTPLTKEEMVHYALIGESVASGSSHADNVAPCLVGGMIAAILDDKRAGADRVRLIDLPIPKGLWCVVLHPHIKVETKAARGLLKHDLPLKTHIQQSGHLIQFLTGLQNSDFNLIAEGLKDLVIEPQRARLIPGFRDIQYAALSTGALGCSISGAGPSIFALVESQHRASDVQNKMNEAAKSHVESTSWAFAIKKEGARLLDTK